MLLGALGVIGDLLAAQRTLSQRTFERVRRIELQLGVEPSHYERGAPAAEKKDPAAERDLAAEKDPAADRDRIAESAPGTPCAGNGQTGTEAPNRRALEV